MTSFRYIHEHPDWPRFRWRNEETLQLLAKVRHNQGHLMGQMESLGFDLRQEAIVRTLTQDVVKTSEIEGERLDIEPVRSSIARRLGMDTAGLTEPDLRVEGAVEMMIDATGNYDEALTAERIFSWQAALFPTGFSGMRRIRVGSWRDDVDGPMQVVSGPIGRERVHFEAPTADRVASEMRLFLDWFNAPSTTDEVLKAALAHLWFVTVHPLDDGNGRVARALADLLLGRSEQTSQRFYSMSGRILQERADYYKVLEQTQKGTLDVTMWMQWFLRCLNRAIEGAQETLRTVLEKARFWDSVRDVSLNTRQRKMLNRLLDGFRGKLTTSKWAKICKTSDDSALRDITELLELGILERSTAGGRSTSYTLRGMASSTS